MLDPDKEKNDGPEKDNREEPTPNIENFIDGLRKSAEKIGETAEKMKNIAKSQSENKDKLKEMNEKLANAVKRLEEVRKRLAEARLNQLNDQIKKIKSDKSEKDANIEPKAEKPTLFISKSEIFLSKINRNSFKEFTDFTEFLKFHKMNYISDDEITAVDIEAIIKKIIE